MIRAAERIGPWGNFNFGPLVYPSPYIIIMFHENLISFVIKGSPPEKMVQFYALW